MEIAENQVTRDIILIFLMCNEMLLDFEEIKKLYEYDSKIFWNCIYFLFPCFKISIKKFTKLAKSADNIAAKFKLDDTELTGEDLLMYNSIKIFIKDKYEGENELYEAEEIKDYLYYNNRAEINVILQDGSNVSNVKKDFIDNYSSSIDQIKVNNKTFNKISTYGFKLKQELVKNSNVKQAVKKVFSKIKLELANESK